MVFIAKRGHERMSGDASQFRPALPILDIPNLMEPRSDKGPRHGLRGQAEFSTELAVDHRARDLLDSLVLKGVGKRARREEFRFASGCRSDPSPTPKHCFDFDIWVGVAHHPTHSVVPRRPIVKELVNVGGPIIAPRPQAALPNRHFRRLGRKIEELEFELPPEPLFEAGQAVEDRVQSDSYFSVRGPSERRPDGSETHPRPA